MVKTNNAITLNMGLCEGRHEIPQVTDGYIFPSEVNPIDLRQLNNIAVDRLMDICEKEYNDKKQIIWNFKQNNDLQIRKKNKKQNKWCYFKSLSK